MFGGCAPPSSEGAASPWFRLFSLLAGARWPPTGSCPRWASSPVKPRCPPGLPARGPERAGASCRASCLRLLGFLILQPQRRPGDLTAVSFRARGPSLACLLRLLLTPYPECFLVGWEDQGRAGLPCLPGGGSFSVKGNILHLYGPLHENNDYHNHSRDGRHLNHTWDLTFAGSLPRQAAGVMFNGRRHQPPVGGKGPHLWCCRDRPTQERCLLQKPLSVWLCVCLIQSGEEGFHHINTRKYKRAAVMTLQSGPLSTEMVSGRQCECSRKNRIRIPHQCTVWLLLGWSPDGRPFKVATCKHISSTGKNLRSPTQMPGVGVRKPGSRGSVSPKDPAPCLTEPQACRSRERQHNRTPLAADSPGW